MGTLLGMCVHHTTGQPLVKCKICGRMYQHPCRNGEGTTTSMLCHLNKCVDYMKSQNSSSSSTSSGIERFLKSKSQERRVLTNEGVVEQVLKFFISGNIPFNQAENPHLRRLISWIMVQKTPCSVPGRKML